MIEKIHEANRLRKSSQPEKALPIYRELYVHDSNMYNTAGLLHCLRKTSNFEEAIPLCDEIYEKYLDSEWCRREAIWTLIQGNLDKLEKSATIEEVTSVVKSILRFEPIEISTKWRVIRRVIKAARDHRNWRIVTNWIDKIDYQQLSNEPLIDESGLEGWSDLAIWYNLKIRSLIEIGSKEEAITLARAAIKLFQRQRTFFARLEALATFRLSRLLEAEKLYSDLCNKNKPEWWILYEYAKVLMDLGKNDLALKTMCNAVKSSNKLESLVSILYDLGELLKAMPDEINANNHFLLCKFIRQKNK